MDLNLKKKEVVDDESGGGGSPKVITLLSSLLQQVAELNDRSRRLNSLSQRISVFHGLTPPSISIQSYLERIFKYANCSPSCFVVAYVYLDRFVNRHPSLSITSFNVHRLLITTVLVSVKFMDDIYYNNAYYAKIGGVSTAEMNVLEVDLLFGLGFELNVSPATFHTYCSYLQTQMWMQSTPSPAALESPPRQIQQHCCLKDEDSAPQHHLAAAVTLT